MKIDKLIEKHVIAIEMLQKIEFYMKRIERLKEDLKGFGAKYVHGIANEINASIISYQELIDKMIQKYNKLWG